VRFGVRCDFLNFFEDIREVELAFFNVQEFLKLRIGDILKEVKGRGLEVVTIHAPNAKIHRVEEFEIVIERCCNLANKLDCDTVVLHPCFLRKKFDREGAIRVLDEEITSILENYRVTLCWETFINENRLFRNPYEIYRFCVERDFYGMCYDFSHIPDDQNYVIKQIREFRNHIFVYHISNRERANKTAGKPLNHIPIFDEKGVLDFRKILNTNLINPASSLILEYRNEFSEKLREDLKLLKDNFNRKKWIYETVLTKTSGSVEHR